MNVYPLSYLITSFAPQNINEKFVKLKKEFNLYSDQLLTEDRSVITMNTAHITLKGRFYMKEDIDEAIIIEQLDKINLKKIDIKTSNVTVFKTAQHGNVLVSMVEQPEDLTNLHNEILEKIKPYIQTQFRFEGSEYTPHMSFLYNLAEKDVNLATEYIRENILPIIFSLDNINILKNIPNINKERIILKTYTTSSPLE